MDATVKSRLIRNIIRHCHGVNRVQVVLSGFRNRLPGFCPGMQVWLNVVLGNALVHVCVDVITRCRLRSPNHLKPVHWVVVPLLKCKLV